MTGNKVELFVHMVWTTTGRQPLITPDVRRAIYRSIQSEARRAGVHVLALNGAADHVHLLAALPATISIAELMQRVKGVSSQVGRQTCADGAAFSWQHGYGCFTISRFDVPRVIDYIGDQERHHAEGNYLLPEWEPTDP